MTLTAMMICIAAVSGPVLDTDDGRFTLDGASTFLLGCSYYGALGVEDESVWKTDLGELRKRGFNWIRVWATWNAFDNDVSAVTSSGEAREPYMGRLSRLTALAGELGMVVDITVTRGKEPYPSEIESHKAVMITLAKALKPYRNVYFDLANERDVGDARYVPKDELKQLAAAVREVDPDRLITASSGGDMNPEDIMKFIEKTSVDFITPHRPRNAESPGQTAETTRKLREALAAGGKTVPIHFQEPFRRGYANWEPKAEDFILDLAQAREGGAAGWCFHNGGERTKEDERPRRSFDMRPGEGGMFKQLDPEELRFFEMVK